MTPEKLEKVLEKLATTDKSTLVIEKRQSKAKVPRRHHHGGHSRQAHRRAEGAHAVFDLRWGQSVMRNGRAVSVGVGGL